MRNEIARIPPHIKGEDIGPLDLEMAHAWWLALALACAGLVLVVLLAVVL